MERRTRWIAGALVAWTAFVWINRLRNLANDTEATTADQVVSGGLSLVLLWLAVAGALALVVSWRRRWTLDAPQRQALRLLAGATVVVWVIRGVDIVLSGWDLAFVAVHLVLAGISIALAVGTWRGTTSTSASTPVLAA
jgi:hypothetical protein